MSQRPKPPLVIFLDENQIPGQRKALKYDTLSNVGSSHVLPLQTAGLLACSTGSRWQGTRSSLMVLNHPGRFGGRIPLGAKSSRRMWRAGTGLSWQVSPAQLISRLRRGHNAFLEESQRNLLNLWKGPMTRFIQLQRAFWMFVNLQLKSGACAAWVTELQVCLPSQLLLIRTSSRRDEPWL